MNTVTDTLGPGSIIQDTYRIDKLLGEGGMGATFAGRNLASDHPVAIKVISASFAKNSRATDLFRREANLLRTVQHESVVRYETTLQDKEGRLFLIMEMLQGQSLLYYLEKGARLSVVDTLRLGRRLAGGLDTIAAVDIVHRDIAPDNIFIPDEDIQRAKLIDFGLASNTVGTEKSILGDDFAGKFSYCAPEQFGQFDGKISPRTDAYALGLVLMRVAGLDVPGLGQGMAAGAARREDIEIDEAKVGPVLARVLRTLLKADPSERPSPITPVFEDALAQVGQSQPRSDDTQVAVDKVEKKARPGGNTAMLGLAAGLAAVVALAGGYFVLQGDGGGNGRAVVQVDIAQDALEESDAFEAIDALLAEGGPDNLNAALAALLEMGRDAERPSDERIAALIRAARMSDPETFATTPTPFDAPSASMARRLYQNAANLGSAEARAAVERLENL